MKAILGILTALGAWAGIQLADGFGTIRWEILILLFIAGVVIDFLRARWRWEERDPIGSRLAHRQHLWRHKRH